MYPVIGGTDGKGASGRSALNSPNRPRRAKKKTPKRTNKNSWKPEMSSSAGSTVGPPEETEALSKAEALALELNPVTGQNANRGRSSNLRCAAPLIILSVELLSLPRGEAAPVGSEHLHFHCHDPSYGGNVWSVAVYGRFHYVYQHRVWLNWKEWKCDKITGELKQLEFGVVKQYLKSQLRNTAMRSIRTQLDHTSGRDSRARSTLSGRTDSLSKFWTVARRGPDELSGGRRGNLPESSEWADLLSGGSSC